MRKLHSVDDPVEYKRNVEKIMDWVASQPRAIRLLIHEYSTIWVRRALKAGKKTERDIVRYILLNRKPLVPEEFDFDL